MPTRSLIYKTGVHTFAFCYADTPEGRTSMLRHLGHMAANPQIPFTWWDAGVLCQHVRHGAGASCNIESQTSTKH